MARSSTATHHHRPEPPNPLDRADPDLLARFWAAALGHEFQPPPEGKTIKNRLHLDVMVGGGREIPLATRKERVDAEARRLAELGAVTIGFPATEGLDHYAVAMRDPEGNEFDIA